VSKVALERSPMSQIGPMRRGDCAEEMSADEAKEDIAI
jgi:hypothetical protein